MTVALLDRIAPLVRERLGKTVDEMPLAAILEGEHGPPGAVLPLS